MEESLTKSNDVRIFGKVFVKLIEKYFLFRFMPDGIYLNAKELGVKKLAAKMNELINDPEKYANYFKWKKYYSYHSKHERPETDEYCKMCELLNNEEQLKKTTIIDNFRDWWDNPKVC